MTKLDHLRSLSRICRRFGGRLAIVTQRYYDRIFGCRPYDPNGVCESPFTSAHGIHWQKKIIYAVRGREEVGSIIHEMGHVFADLHHPQSGQSREWAWFGWEVAMARQIDAWRVWSRQNGNYNTSESGGDEWGILSTSKRKALVAERLAHAQKIGVLTSNGTPRSIR